MIKLLPLLAVVLTPHYTYNYNNVLQESIIYDMTYNIVDDSFLLGERPENVSPNMSYNVFTLTFDEILVSNYEVSVQAELTFNPTMVAEFGACAIELRYNYGNTSTQVLTTTFAVSYFTNQFNFGYNNRWNSTWTHNQTISGPLQYFSFGKTDIEQGEFVLNFYAYKENATKTHYDAIQQGYYDGYNSGLADGYDDGYDDAVSFYRADWLGWIGNTLSGIMDTELFMGFTLGGIFGICIVIAVSIWFLKMFAGG